MGVLSCNRNGCTNILCHRYSPIFGYICEECFTELKQKRTPVSDFMFSKKETVNFDPFTESYYNSVFEEI